MVYRYGPIAVYAVGIRENGYPPTWIGTGSEVQTIRKHLEKEFNNSVNNDGSQH